MKKCIQDVRSCLVTDSCLVLWGHCGLYNNNDFDFVQGEDEEADWDLGLLNEEDDGVVHWVGQL